MGRQRSPCWAPTKKKLNDYRKIKLKDFCSIDKDKDNEVEYDIALLLQYQQSRSTELKAFWWLFTKVRVV
jgi:hypothetical protein